MKTERHFVAYGERCTYWVIRGNTVSFNIQGPDRLHERGQFMTYVMRKLQERKTKANLRLRGEHMFDVKFTDLGELQLMNKGLLKSTGADRIR